MTAGSPNLIVSAFGKDSPKAFLFLGSFYQFEIYKAKFSWKGVVIPNYKFDVNP